MITKSQVKELINAMADAVNQSLATTGAKDDITGGVKLELGMFLMYLSASDGEIQWSEASMISDLCDLNLTPQTIGAFIREHNIYSTEFENRVPLSLQTAVTADNALFSMGRSDVPDLSELIIVIYKAAAELLINSDSDVDSNELSDCQIYINMMENYANNNSTRRKAAISGFVKNSGNVSAPTKSGVSAPKKKG